MLKQLQQQQWFIYIIMFLCLSTIVEGGASSSAGLPDLKPLPQGIILGRPTDTSIEAYIMTETDMDCFLEYGTDSNEFTHQTEIMSIPAKDVKMVILKDLEPNTKYVYRLWQCNVGSNDFQSSDFFTFHTQRSS